MNELETAVVRRKPAFLWLARRYVARRMRRAFDGVHVGGLAEVRELLAREPVIVAANHVAWWDPLFAVLLDEALGATSFALMDQENLERLPFFGWVGAVPIDRKDARAAIRQLRAAATLLDAPGRALWIFPQGTQRPAHLRPLGLQRGVARLAEEAGAKVVPLALNYLYRQGSEPAAIATFGEPLDPAAWRRAALVDELDARLRAGLDAIDAFATEGAGSFEPLLRPRQTGDAPAAARLLGGRGNETTHGTSEKREYA